MGMVDQSQFRKEQVKDFLDKNGFTGVNEGKTSGRTRLTKKTTYPLHYAAECGNDKMVAWLLEEGADPEQKNSSGKTAAEIASSKNKKGSHSSVVSVLGGA